MDNNAHPPLIEMQNISKVFHTPSGDFHALKEVSVSFNRSQFTSVVGKSGSGKSTLVNMLTGIDHPTTGRVVVNGDLIHEMKEGQMSIWRGKNLGIVFQFYQLLPMLSLHENVMLPMDFAGLYDPRERPDRAMSLLQKVGLAEVANKLPGAVSGGQQQSAAIARALANDPPILIADEPTGNLDTRSAASVLEICFDLVEKGKTIIMVTHDMTLARQTDRILLLVDGKLAFTPEIKTNETSLP